MYLFLHSQDNLVLEEPANTIVIVIYCLLVTSAGILNYSTCSFLLKDSNFEIDF